MLPIHNAASIDLDRPRNNDNQREPGLLIFEERKEDVALL